MSAEQQLVGELQRQRPGLVRVHAAPCARALRECSGARNSTWQLEGCVSKDPE